MKPVICEINKNISGPFTLISLTFKVALDNIFEIFFFAEFHLSCKMLLIIYKYKKKNSKNPSESEEIAFFFVKYHTLKYLTLLKQMAEIF